MKKILLTLAIICVLYNSLQAQDVIKVGDEKTITCGTTFIAEVQNYFSDGKPSSKSKMFMEAKGDSLYFFEALIDPSRENQKVIKQTVAKKDIDQGDWGFEVSTTKVNGAAYVTLKLGTTDAKSVVTEEMHKNDEVEKYDDTNRVLIYFNSDKEAEAKAWAEKIKKMIQ
jgi:hypothetical protein